MQSPNPPLPLQLRINRMQTHRSRWINSTDPSNAGTLLKLESSLAAFYTNPENYYSEISFCSGAWRTDPTMTHLAALAKNSTSILELGCGCANILEHHPEIAGNYTGCDFSEEVISSNRDRFPASNFLTIGSSQFEENSQRLFDLVFSTFVIEHVVFPERFLEASVRQVKPGGLLAIRCPDFLTRGSLPSLRIGLSHDPLRQKLSKFRLLDFLFGVTDRFLFTPQKCRRLRNRTQVRPKFWINSDPACLYKSQYRPDYDAVYWTWDLEIISALESFGCSLLDTGHPTTGGREIYIVVKKPG